MERELAIRLRGVVKRYGEITAVAGLDLDVPTGTCVGLLGPNGAGKSTLARLAAGVFQPRSGAVYVAGKDLRDTAGSTRARLVRVSFQTPEHELFRRTLGAEIDWEAGLLGASATEMRERTRLALVECGAEVPLDVHPYDLDPWQRKLFACVSALAIPGRLVILDEPTLRLGQRVRTGLGLALRKYAAAGGAVMLVTHDHEFAASTCDTIAVVKAGKIDRSGPVTSTLEAAAEHAATNIYSFPSFYLDRAVRQRSKLPAERSVDLQM
jgi:energy-coupling factor transporter ATP-binding protein EcfA2